MTSGANPLLVIAEMLSSLMNGLQNFCGCFSALPFKLQFVCDGL